MLEIVVIGIIVLLNIFNLILKRSLFVNGWRDVAHYFKHLLQQNLKNNITIASVPCGVMQDIASVDFSNYFNYKIIGVDIDEKVLSSADFCSRKKEYYKFLELRKEDAWNLSFKKNIDIIMSCGLNIYEFNKTRILNLYKSFYEALSPGGILISSFLTYPPDEGHFSDWDLTKIAEEDMILERILFKDILDMKFRNFKTSKEMINELKNIGFQDVKVYFDNQKIFPTIFATRD